MDWKQKALIAEEYEIGTKVSIKIEVKGDEYEEKECT